MSFVEIRQIYKSFGQEQVLDNVSFEIEKGECFGLIGPNGAGKSTLIDIMTGLTPFNSGSVTINQQEVPKDIVDIRKIIGLVPQEIALMQDLNAKSNLEYFGGLYGLSGKLLKERMEEALEIVGLEQHTKKPVKSFSGGMQRRLNIAAAIMHRPELLILDEPTVGVDPQSRNKIFEFINYLNAEYQTTVLYTSHYMEEVEALCERLFILDNGQQVGYGSQEEIKQMVQDTVKWHIEVERPPHDFQEALMSRLQGVEQVIVDGTHYHLMVNPVIFTTKELMELVHEMNVELTTLTKEALSLEEAFLQLTGKRLRD